MSIDTEPESNSFTSARSSDVADIRAASDLVPKTSFVPILFAVLAAVATVVMTQALRWPPSLQWLSIPSSIPALTVFGFTGGIAIYRFVQMVVWRLRQPSWSVDAIECVRRKMVVDSLDHTPEGIRDGALRETRGIMRSAAAASQWLVYVGCFIILLLAIPMFVAHLQTASLQTSLMQTSSQGADIKMTLWLPTVLIAAASLVWLLNVWTSAIASMAIEAWYSKATIALLPIMTTTSDTPPRSAKKEPTEAFANDFEDEDIFGQDEQNYQPDGPSDVEQPFPATTEKAVSGERAYPKSRPVCESEEPSDDSSTNDSHRSANTTPPKQPHPGSRPPFDDDDYSPL